jgi:hypothetical protein
MVLINTKLILWKYSSIWVLPNSNNSRYNIPPYYDTSSHKPPEQLDLQVKHCVMIHLRCVGELKRW